MTDSLSTAIQFINTTSSHVFLTGKAGTGKTTFLKDLSGYTHKNYIVVAPTGIAALNAGGVTVHSQFLLPFGTFLPERSLPVDFSYEGGYYSQDVLARKHPLNSARKQVLRSIDLLVIDEVSMLRADLLDAIDYRLKAARGNFKQSFGGVQLLLIGDLYQLPPVIKREDEKILKAYYSSPWFYESRGLKESSFVYIELDKIYRQQHADFIQLLNNLRNNTVSHHDIAVLNSYYRTTEEIKKITEVITLTTHNRKADELNQTTLQALASPSYFFEARITDDFPENMFPVQSKLELKKGAQIMFVKNDTEEKRYFNGKLAIVNNISSATVEVKMSGSNELYTLKMATWQNKKYTIDPETRILNEDIIGTFEQYPVKLAWAITVHKSQGLTFDKAIIDVGQAFADGQVYVALSRLRTLDGLVLSAQINPGVIRTDKSIVSFTEDNNRPDDLHNQMKQKQLDFIQLLINKTYDFSTLLKEIKYIQKDGVEIKGFKDASMQPVLSQIAIALQAEKENTEKFRIQLTHILRSGDKELLLERIKKGSIYYKGKLQENLKLLLTHMAEVSKLKRVKTYLNQLNDLDQLCCRQIADLDKVAYLTEGILKGVYKFDLQKFNQTLAIERTALIQEVQKNVGGEVISKVSLPKGKSKKKRNEQSTYDVTLNLLNEGKDVTQIAKERGLVVGTIEGHLAKAVSEARISIFKFMTEDEVNTISKAIEEMPVDFSSKELYIKMNGQYGYGKLRAVMAHLGKKSVKKNKKE